MISKEGAPSANTIFSFEAEGFSDKFSTPVCLLRGGFSSLASSNSKDKGIPDGRTKCSVPWREQDMGFLAKGKGDNRPPLHMICGEGLV